nr:Chain A, M2 protein, BM2 protein chimera [unidentified]2LJB_B Chain B, M2 protein, BM2 protein chimera [unidentified]2LJB_C Chain C, M2 protein, BM2 protein chimera [unidentified]2LJB_D Chain D, M2 protein, BM2 protein chimera [unidentified]2LJC_A Chain A, M2 protein, BM2 protein chimera [unidentified]2LJC_B Chain B, M2 protein, BM2 protein chimera [unidentified]2LJC_C Chain C, M2 protein, BM2 protein chimera [unidentified]2LJC_D Chain D, M2 protein, BM2 protein chimera [unidentified]
RSNDSSDPLVVAASIIGILHFIAWTIGHLNQIKRG